MRKISILFLMTFLIVGTFSFVAADDVNSEIEIPEAKKVGFFENAFDQMRLAFTFNKEKKIERVLSMAEKRLAEAEAMADENPEKAERAREIYDKLVSRAEEIFEKMESNTDGINGSVSDMERIARIQDKFERHREHTDEIYTRALERFEANNASDEKIERFEMFYDHALNRSYKMEEMILDRQENIMNKHKILSEMSDEELENLFKKIKEDEGLVRAREERIKRAKERFEERIGWISEKLDQANLTEQDTVESVEDTEMVEEMKDYEQSENFADIVVSPTPELEADERLLDDVMVSPMSDSGVDNLEMPSGMD
ncbi:hypothetical protein KAT36_00615 [Candidatus Pacearchaeota archaeon]|nr:hypothetical protein [Candidatus Pacearchaeota archaeon]